MFKTFKPFNPPPPFDAARGMLSSPATRGRACPELVEGMKEGDSAAANEEARIRAAYSKRKDLRLYSWFDPGHLFIVQQRERRILALLRAHGYGDLQSTTLLEIGCGNGYWLREFIKWGAQPENLTGIDLLEDRVALANKLCARGVKIERRNAAKPQFADESFDLVLQSMVFTSILDPSLKAQVAREMLRIVKPDGLVLWYDYHVDNPWNPDVRGIKRSEILRLFPHCRIELERATLAPPLTRFLAPCSYLACYLLEKLPLLCTHYLGVIRKDKTYAQ